ncbi:MAG: M20 family metallopeptidase [Dethiosulfatibacter sp.]|nr:M20 family metallopeptidase [Dethiosulfatibacter sp.]
MQLIEFISNYEVLKIHKELISIEGHKEVDDKESKVADYIQKLLEKEGIEAELDLIEENRPNVYGYIRGEEEGIELMFNGHTDTIPGFTMDYDAFKPFVKDGKIFGRGSADMKAGLTAALASMIAIKRSGVKLKKTVMFAGVIDEEERSKGTERLIEKGIIPKMVIIGEPTQLEVSIAHKGMEWMEVKFKGRSTHGSRPHEGINAIYMASEFNRLVMEELQPEIESKQFDLVGNGSINVGVINGGNDPNIVPDTCTIQIDRRWLPNETLESIYKEVQDLAQKVIDKFGGSFETREMRELTASMINAPHSIAIEHPLVIEAVKAVEKHTNTKRKPRDFPAWSDAGLLSNHSEAECIILGPGNINQAHANDEFCEIDQVIQGTNIYFDLIQEFCVNKEEK